MNSPEMIIVGGPNGAGKSTFAGQFLKSADLPFLNADLEAAKLNSEAPDKVAIAAVQQFLRQLEELLLARQSFMLESTLSGRTLVRRIESAVANGFHTLVVYIFAASEEVCVSRVYWRVRKYGHHVPPSGVRRRFGRSITNFLAAISIRFP